MDKRRIKEIFSRYPEVIAAYLFGSLAAGREKRKSDADVAVILEENIHKARAMTIQLQLMADLEDVYNREVEVVLLNETSLFLISEVLKGKLIYDSNPIKRAEFESIKRREYFDFVLYLKRHREALLERIKTKGLSGAYGGY